MRPEYSLLMSAIHKSDGTLVNGALKLFGFPEHSRKGREIELRPFLKVTQDAIANFEGVTEC